MQKRSAEMKGLIRLVGILMMIIVASCTSKKETTLTKKEIKVKVDSIINSRMTELNQQAAEDLDRRKSIEVKAKADSILQVYIQGQPLPQTPVPQDTATPALPPQP